MKELPEEPKWLFNQEALCRDIRDEIKRRKLSVAFAARDIGADRSHLYQTLYGRKLQSVELYLRLTRWLERSRAEATPPQEPERKDT